MGEKTTGIRAILSHPYVYELWSRSVGGERARATLVREHARPSPDARVLDLGCGPGELLCHLGDVRYTGVDINPDYIAHARARFGDRAEFYVNDATALDLPERSFDLVLSVGVLHHLDDAGAMQLLRLAADALAPGGRMVAVDPTFVQKQSPLARFIISRDRGRHVRTPDEYMELAADVFSEVTHVVRGDLLRIPYTHCALECRMRAASTDSRRGEELTTDAPRR
jgi:SAM-dependent methyltransferase